MSRGSKRAVVSAAAAAVLALAAYGTLLPGTGKPFGFYMPQLTHLVAFSLLGVLTWSALQPRGAARWAVAGGLLIAALGTEIAQIWVPRREAVLQDGLLNLIGVGLGAGLAALLIHWFRPPDRIPAVSTEPRVLPARSSTGSGEQVAAVIQGLVRHRLVAALPVMERLGALDESTAIMIRPLAEREWKNEAWRSRWEEAVLGRFERAEVRVLVLKGAALARRLYPTPETRPRVDLDLFVGRDGIAKARGLLQAEGYRLSGTTVTLSQETWVRTTGGQTELIDLHFLVTDQPALADCWTFEALYARSIPMADHGTTVRRLDDTGALLHACVHYVASDPHHFRPDLALLDIAILVQRVWPARRSEFDAMGADCGLEGVAAVALHAARTRLDADIDEDWIGALWSTGARRWRSCLSDPDRGAVKNLMLGARGQGSISGGIRFLIRQVFPPERYMEQKYPTSSATKLWRLYLRRARGH